MRYPMEVWQCAEVWLRRSAAADFWLAATPGTCVGRAAGEF